jgi:hypothetical protein
MSKQGEEMTKESINGIFNGMSDLLVKKNADYKGASFDLGLNGNMVHLWDKVRRYRNMVENSMQGKEPNFESIRDTLQDIIGYAVIGIHILDAQKKENEPRVYEKSVSNDDEE